MNTPKIPPALKAAYQAMSAEEKADVVSTLAKLFAALPPAHSLTQEQKRGALSYREQILTALNDEEG